MAEQLVNSGNSVHLVGRNENETKNISEKLGCAFTIADVLQDGFVDKVKNDISDVKGRVSVKVSGFASASAEILLLFWAIISSLVIQSLVGVIRTLLSNPGSD